MANIGEGIVKTAIKQMTGKSAESLAKKGFKTGLLILAAAGAITMAADRAEAAFKNRKSLTMKERVKEAAETAGYTTAVLLVLAKEAKISRGDAFKGVGQAADAMVYETGLTLTDLDKHEDLFKKEMRKSMKRFADNTDSDWSKANIKGIVNRTFKEIRVVNLDWYDKMSDEELAKHGLIRVKGHTRANGTKVRDHYRKIKQ